MHKYENLSSTPIILTQDGIDPPSQLPTIKWVNIESREEHEVILRDQKRCEELGIDRDFEIMLYLKRWGAWL